MPSPIEFLREAVKAVPAVKYALGVGGIVAAVAIVYSFKLDPRVAFVGTIVTLVLMGVLVVFARMAALSGTRLHLPALVFTWFVLLLFMATSVSLFSSVFFEKPLDLHYWLQGSETPITQNETPAPTVLDAKWSMSMPLPNGWSGLSLYMPSLPQGWFGTNCVCAHPTVLPLPTAPFQKNSMVEFPNRCNSPVEVAIGKLEPTSVGSLPLVTRTIIHPGSVLKADVGGAVGFAVLLKKCPNDS